MMNESILLLYRTKLVRHLEKWEFLCYNNIAEIEQHIDFIVLQRNRALFADNEAASP